MLEGIAEQIESMIDNIGRAVQIRTFTNSGTTYNPDRAESDVDAVAAILPYNAVEVDGSTIQTDDKKAYIKGSANITKQDRIVDGNLAYQIINLETLEPGGERFLYVAQLRK